MRRVAIVLVLLMMAPLALASPESTVEINYERRLSDIDLGLNGGEMSPTSESILLFGAEGYARLIDADKADKSSSDIELEKQTSQDYQDAAWHPGGNTAILVGDNGTVLRYVLETHAIQPVNDSSSVADKDLTAVMWRMGGDRFYVGSSDGSLWSYSESEGFIMLEHDGDSKITDIACHKNQNICVISSLNDGIGVIGKDDVISWIGAASHTWIGVSCDDGSMNSCSGYGSGKMTTEISLDMSEPAGSTYSSPSILGQLTGDLISDSIATSSATLLVLAPQGLVRWDQYDSEAYLMFSNNDSVEEDVLLAADTIIVAWETDFNTGFFITDEGRVVSFKPLMVTDDTGMVGTVVMVVVAIAVPGVFLGMIYWNSPWLQRKYNSLFGKKKTTKKTTKKR